MLFATGQAMPQDMDAMWGENVVKLRAQDAKRGQLFEEGNYAMFIHWGLYAQCIDQPAFSANRFVPSVASNSAEPPHNGNPNN